MRDELIICSAEHPIIGSKSNAEYVVGRLQLSKHFNIGNSLASIAVSKEYAKQLLLKEPSDFNSGRVPLYVCNCCADLGCGAITVLVENVENVYAWSDFGYEGFLEETISQSDYMKRTGPFIFNSEQYTSAISPYCKNWLTNGSR